jgi:hypothetical protein
MTMEKQPKTRQEIEHLLLAEMRTYSECEHAVAVVVVAISGHGDTATWTVVRFNPGKSNGEACDCALQLIVPRLQRVYDMVQKH